MHDYKLSEIVSEEIKRITANIRLGFRTTKTVKNGMVEITYATAKGVFHHAEPKYANLSCMFHSVSVY